MYYNVLDVILLAWTVFNNRDNFTWLYSIRTHLIKREQCLVVAYFKMLRVSRC